MILLENYVVFILPNTIYEILGNDKVINDIFFTRDQTHIRSLIKHNSKLWRKPHKKYLFLFARNKLKSVTFPWKNWISFLLSSIYKIYFLRVNKLQRLSYSSNAWIFDKNLKFLWKPDMYFYSKKKTNLRSLC